MPGSTVTYYASAKNAGVGTTPTFNYQAGIVAGDLLLLVCASKYPANTLTSIPTGYTLVGTAQGGPAGTGADAGAVLISIYYKIATGSESGSITITNPNGTGIIGTLWQFHKASASDTWDTVAFTSAALNAGTTSVSFTSPSVISFSNGDAFVLDCGLNTDLYTYSSLSLTTPGLTNSVADALASRNTTGGDDLSLSEGVLAITGGAPTTEPVFSMTASGSTASRPAGAAVFIKVSATPYSFVPRMTMLGAG